MYAKFLGTKLKINVFGILLTKIKSNKFQLGILMCRIDSQIHLNAKKYNEDRKKL